MGNTSVTYHLWLKPSGPPAEELASTIRRLALELNAPVFQPHVTLLSVEGTDREEHIRRTSELARRLDPFLIVLTGLSYRSEHFQCLFATVQESQAVMRANVVAKEVFAQAAAPYMPHVSLLYGLYPEVLKRKIIGRLGSPSPGSFLVSAIHLIRAESRDPIDWHDVFAAPMGTATITRSAGPSET
jgi:2'-5' RNA ligase